MSPMPARLRTLLTWIPAAVAMGVVSSVVVPGSIPDPASPRRLVVVVFHADRWAFGWSHLGLLGLVVAAAVMLHGPAARPGVRAPRGSSYLRRGTTTDPARGTVATTREP